jgi:NADH dehydrogenase
MNLVVGSTGFLGGEICRRLRLEGRPVRGLVRETSDPAAVGRLKALGVETVEGDLKDLQSLQTACDGVHTVISTTTSMRSRQEGDSIESVDGSGQLNLVRAAGARGVSRYVYVSYSGGVGNDDPLTRAKRSVEDAIRQSGMTYTILRPSYFMEVWLGPTVGFDFPNAKATVFGTGENRVSWISLADVAAFAVASLENPAARNAVLELGGPEALTPLEVVRVFEELGGRPFEVQHVPEEALLARGEAATDSRGQTFAALMLSHARGNAIDMDEMLGRFPVRLTSVREYAGRVLGKG